MEMAWSVIWNGILYLHRTLLWAMHILLISGALVFFTDLSLLYSYFNIRFTLLLRRFWCKLLQLTFQLEINSLFEKNLTYVIEISWLTSIDN